MKLCSLSEVTEKNIFPIVEVTAIGRNSETDAKFCDFDNNARKASAQSVSTFLVFQTFCANWWIKVCSAAHFLKGK